MRYETGLKHTQGRAGCKPNASVLAEFDAAPYLSDETTIAAYLTDILEANDPAQPMHA
jgi:DNA-binding phage protein